MQYICQSRDKNLYLQNYHYMTFLNGNDQKQEFQVILFHSTPLQRQKVFFKFCGKQSMTICTVFIYIYIQILLRQNAITSHHQHLVKPFQ